MHSPIRRPSFLSLCLSIVALAGCSEKALQGHAVNDGLHFDQSLQDHGHQGQTTLRVVAKGFVLAPHSSQARAGLVSFSVTNEGTMPHNFAIEGNGVVRETPVIRPGETAILTVALQPGIYTYKCTVHFHSLLGMKGTLSVTDGEASIPEQHDLLLAAFFPNIVYGVDRDDISIYEAWAG